MRLMVLSLLLGVALDVVTVVADAAGGVCFDGGVVVCVVATCGDAVVVCAGGGCGGAAVNGAGAVGCGGVAVVAAVAGVGGV